eukprot:TRINITY_DN5786_c0_g1_i1.p1 TRINITY_DN5786_c0_g1~~TRINITY_DN5786_c0_g1_i1.p1  ORF type:complete len:201 (+),score=76.46 TRINITY_DN5786_c0_g1_i1:73-603(+)
MSNSHLVYPGIKFQKGKKLELNEIPGLKEAGWKPRHRGKNHLEGEKLKEYLNALLALLKANQQYSWPFHHPVDANEVPDYYKVMMNPLSFQDIQTKLDEEEFYIIPEIFVADVRRVFRNCKHYNKSDTVFYKAATHMEGYLNQLLKKKREEVLTEAAPLFAAEEEGVKDGMEIETK